LWCFCDTMKKIMSRAISGLIQSIVGQVYPSEIHDDYDNYVHY